MTQIPAWLIVQLGMLVFAGGAYLLYVISDSVVVQPLVRDRKRQKQRQKTASTTPLAPILHEVAVYPS